MPKKPNVLDLAEVTSFVGRANGEIPEGNIRNDPSISLAREFVRNDIAVSALSTFTAGNMNLILLCMTEGDSEPNGITNILSSIMAFGFQVGREYGRREMSREMEIVMGLGEGLGEDNKNE